MEEEHELEDCFLSDELCLCCLRPIAHGANFCHECGAPLGFLAATLPYQSILAEGFLYRRAIQQPTSLITVAGVWMIFGTLVFTGPLYAGEGVNRWRAARSFEDGLVTLYASAWSIIGLTGIAGSTRNYWRYRRMKADEAASAP